uniref:Hexosyltransferase n=1 Tax=Tetraselmis chuii TaxID=63592 RepID=A0A7S1T2H7_9CHLO|mmetsp:Transcript_41509/g.74609  ORF Transcript_41509/g.74609 Transcript_41509/m.74609 type:complete len:202 (+) Transcript_41509:223-828(+)
MACLLPKPPRRFRPWLVGVLLLLASPTICAELPPFRKEGSVELGEQVLAVVGVFSGVGPEYDARRAALRATWFPDSAEELAALERRSRIALRFVVGTVQDEELARALRAEEEAHGEMMRAESVEKYNNLPLKLLRFLEAGLAAHPTARYLLKVDDDVYFLPEQLQPAVGQWTERGADLVGCFMQGKKVNSYNKWAAELFYY